MQEIGIHKIDTLLQISQELVAHWNIAASTCLQAINRIVGITTEKASCVTQLYNLPLLWFNILFQPCPTNAASTSPRSWVCTVEVWFLSLDSMLEMLLRFLSPASIWSCLAYLPAPLAFSCNWQHIVLCYSYPALWISVLLFQDRNSSALGLFVASSLLFALLPRQ